LGTNKAWPRWVRQNDENITHKGLPHPNKGRLPCAGKGPTHLPKLTKYLFILANKNFIDHCHVGRERIDGVRFELSPK